MRISQIFWLLCVTTFPATAAVSLTPAGNGHLLIPAFIAGKGPYPVVLDTGADDSGVYHWFAREQGLPESQAQTVEGMTGSTSSPTYTVRGISIDGQRVGRIVLDSYPDRQDVERQVGVVGNDYMDPFVAVFDYPCGKVSILPATVPESRFLSRHAKRVNGGSVKEGTQLTLPVRVGEIYGLAVLDTGSRQTKLNPAFAQALGLSTGSAPFRDGEVIYGATQNGLTSRYGPVGTVRFADVTIENAEAQIMDLPVMKSFGLEGPAMILGIDFLKHAKLVYRHRDKTFWFDQSSCAVGG